MATKIFVNLPVKNLDQSIAFFKAIGFSFDPKFTDNTAACMVISNDIYAMLLTYPKFKEFTKKPIADAHKTTEVLASLSMDSKAKVDEVLSAAIAGGAAEFREAMDFGFMYGRSFNDLDGHIWEIFWMDPDHIQAT
ncbi:MAG: VOC family protein [Hyphomicrobium sp.]